LVQFEEITDFKRPLIKKIQIVHKTSFEKPNPFVPFHSSRPLDSCLSNSTINKGYA